MSKEQEAATLSPDSMVLGSPIFAETARAVIKQANWTFGNRPQTHINQSCGSTIVGGSTPKALGVVFRAVSAGEVEVLRFMINILEETVNVTAGAEISIASGTATVHFTIGPSASSTLSFDAAAGDSLTEKTVSFATSATGKGWQVVTVSIEKTAIDAAAELRRIRIQDQSITSALPSPAIEGDSETMDVKEEGTNVVLSARALDFIGSSVTATSGSSGTATITVTGGGAAATTTTGSTLVTADPAPAVAGTMYLCDATTAFNVTLPTALAAGNGGEINVCKAAGGDSITIDRAGSDTINGAASTTVSALFSNVTLISDGDTKWYIK